jgi:type VI protein secretion system component Hcp
MNSTMSSVFGARVRLLSLVAIVAGLFASPCNAAETKIYLEIKEIPGEVTDKGYGNQIPVLSYSLDLAAPGGATLTIVKPLDSSSPVLLGFANTGTLIDRAIVREVQSTNGKIDTKKTIDLRDVIISNYQTGGSSGGIPTESLSLNFAKLSIKYQDPGKKGGT